MDVRKGSWREGGYRIDCHQLWHGVSIPAVISGDSTLPKGCISWERLALQERELIYTKAKIKVTSPREPATPRGELENQMEVQECTEQSGTSWEGRGVLGRGRQGVEPSIYAHNSTAPQAIVPDLVSIIHLLSCDHYHHHCPHHNHQ